MDGLLAGVVEDELVDPASVLPLALLLASLGLLLLEAVLLARQAAGLAALMLDAARGCDLLRVFLDVVGVVVVVDGLEMAEDELYLVTGVTLIGLD